MEKLKTGLLINAMIEYYQNDKKRINHFLKVYGFAKAIGENENIPSDMQFILQTAAVVHDIGIKISEEKYNSSAGEYQQVEGPPIAKVMLEKLGYDETVTGRVCFLIAHHHTYKNIEGIDYQILVEADFLVNIFEDNMDADKIKRIKEKIFITETGKRYLDLLYL
ncbi:MAG: HD domain-containing protein [Eubacteriaceae bacterium]|nr:HD domain-containing protein [Eubacteriaceae bacterium]